MCQCHHFWCSVYCVIGWKENRHSDVAAWPSAVFDPQAWANALGRRSATRLPWLDCLRIQVRELELRLRELKDAELARRLHEGQLGQAAQEARDSAMARELFRQEEAGSEEAISEAAASLEELDLEDRLLIATLSFAASMGEDAAGCGAVLQNAGVLG